MSAQYTGRGGLIERLKDEAIAALKAGDKRRTEALRLIVAALKKERIDSRQGADARPHELTVLKRERKRRLEAAELYEQGGRPDLADQERYEEQAHRRLSARGARRRPSWPRIVDEAIAATGAATPKDMGKVMGVAMKKVAGRADGKLLSDLVRARLGA